MTSLPQSQSADTTPKPHPFEQELRSLPTMSVGSLVDQMRDALALQDRRAKRDGHATGHDAARRFLLYLHRCLEEEANRRDREHWGR